MGSMGSVDLRLFINMPRTSHSQRFSDATERAQCQIGKSYAATFLQLKYLIANAGRPPRPPLSDIEY